MSDSRPRWEAWAAWAALIGVTLAIVSAIFYAGSYYGTATNSASNANDKFAEIAKKIDILSGKLDDIPVYHAELDRHDHEIADLNGDVSSLRDKFADVKGAVDVLKTRLDNVISASSVPIMPGRR